MNSKMMLLGGLAAAALMTAPVMAADSWYPLKVNATKVSGEKGEFDYTPLTEKASKNWSICVSVPHMKDPFFVAMNYGIIEEAKLLGVDVQTLDAGGYDKLANQVTQVENCVAGGANAVVLVAISEDGMGNLMAELNEKNIPVIAAINPVNAETAARVLTNPHDEALRLGQFLAAEHPAGSDPVKVGWLPGPKGAGFVTAFETGFKAGIEGSAVEITETKNGDVGKEVQAALVEDMLQAHPDLNYLAGTAVMVEAALPLLKSKDMLGKVKPVSIYTTPGVYEALKAGEIEAAGWAPVVLTSRIVLDTAVRVLENKLEYTDVDAMGKVFTPATAGELDPLSVLSPAGYAPVFSLDQ